VIDVAEGQDIPRKGGPALTRSDLLLINKTSTSTSSPDTEKEMDLGLSGRLMKTIILSMISTIWLERSAAM